MTRDDVLRMAREAGFQHMDAVGDCEEFAYFDIERFAALVAAAEREACAKVCDLFEEKADALNGSIADGDDRNEGRSEYVMGKAIASSRIASAIRARS